MNNNEKIYQKLKSKADSIKNEFNDIKNKINKYDHFKLKHIIKENLIELKNNNFLSDKNKFDDFINEEQHVRDDDLIYQSVVESKIDINNNESNCFDELNELELIAINQAKELESQINVINNKRVKLIVKDFKVKLIEEEEIVQKQVEEDDKYLSNMQNEKDIALETYKFDQNKFIENRVNIFKKHLDSI